MNDNGTRRLLVSRRRLVRVGIAVGHSVGHAMHNIIRVMGSCLGEVTRGVGVHVAGVAHGLHVRGLILVVLLVRLLVVLLLLLLLLLMLMLLMVVVRDVGASSSAPATAVAATPWVGVVRVVTGVVRRGGHIDRAGYGSVGWQGGGCGYRAVDHASRHGLPSRQMRTVHLAGLGGKDDRRSYLSRRRKRGAAGVEEGRGAVDCRMVRQRRKVAACARGV